MIPILMFAGLLSGRWWIVAAAAVAWPVVLVQMHVMAVEPRVVATAALAALNAVIGVAVHKVLAAAWRAAIRLLNPRQKPSAQEPAP